MRGQFLIRPAIGRDLSRIVDIESRSFSNPWSGEILLQHITKQRDGYIYFPVCVRSDTILGYAIGEHYHPEVHITNLAVEPEERRSGIGTELVITLIQWTESRGASELWLEVRESNSPAQVMYRNLGFDVLGRRRGYYDRPKEDALLMFYTLETRGD